jgi:hypothetical protein
MRLDRILRQKAFSARRLLTRAAHTWRDEGARTAWDQLRYALRGVLSRRVSKYVPSDFDLEHGVDTSGIVRISEMEIGSSNYIHGVFYKASSPKVVSAIFQRLNLSWERFHFIDIGSGKGLVLMVAAGYPFRRVSGVEFAADLHRIAEANIAKFAANRKLNMPIRSVCADAAEFEFPSEPLLLYFYEPFALPVVRQVLKNLENSYIEHRREIIIIYHNAPKSSVLSEMSDAKRSLFAASKIFRPSVTVEDPTIWIFETEEASRLAAGYTLSNTHAS